MVKTYKENDKTTVVLSPNFSMSWRLNLYLLMAFSLWVGLLGTGFWIVGAWPIIPFMGAEIVCLGLGLWITQKKLGCREVLSISDNQIVYEQGVVSPRMSIRWQRDAVRGQVLRIGHPLQSPEIALFDTSGNHCRIGAFLNKADSDLLIVCLKNAGIHLRTDNEIVQLAF